VSAKDTNVGKDTEQAVARWLRGNGFAGAERLVRTGYRVATRESADEGDITGTPGITWQVKSLRPHTRAELAVPTWLNETEAQRKAAGSELGFLVVRRWGTTDVGRWWVFQRLGQLIGLAATAEFCDSGITSYCPIIPVRMDMAALSGLLVATGWADVSEEAS
jgi:hypothetical protein